jgi:hypothetical protein
VRSNEYDIKITSGGVFTLRTYGTTQVTMKLYRNDNEEVNLKLLTPDLVNVAAAQKLPAETYRLEVTHFRKGGGGPYEIELKKGDQLKNEAMIPR